MNLIVEEKEKFAIMRLEGRIDATSAPLLEAKISELLSKEILRLLVDFSHVDYLSSAGLRFLLAATKRYKSSDGVLVISAAGEDVMEIIRMAGFEKILNIYPDEKHAIKVLAP